MPNRGEGAVRESLPTVDVLLYALVAACLGVAVAQVWGSIRMSVIAAVLAFGVAGGALLVRPPRVTGPGPSALVLGLVGLGVTAMFLRNHR